MRHNRYHALFRAVIAGALLVGSLPVFSQDLAPRAYLITPLKSNAVILTYSLFDGNLNFDGTVPITDATGLVHAPIVSYVRSMSVGGRSANVLAALPYGVGNFNGKVLGSETNAYRSGLFPAMFRFSVNLEGAPAMDVKEFMRWKQKLLIGASVRVVPQSGQYDPTKLINLGVNRWAFKPELGISRRWGHWILDTYGGAWFFTPNPKFFSENQFNPGINRQTEKPIGAFEGHLSYDVRPRLWVSVDGNFWFGGATSLNGVENPNTVNRNSRVGATASIPVSRHQAVKFSYNNGAYIRFGGNFQNISVAWQYTWFSKH